MKRRVIIHIGLPKCGSSSLQFILASNVERLRDHGFHYPDLIDARVGDMRPNESDATRLSHMFLANTLARASRPGAAAPCPVLTDVFEGFERTSCHSMILSSERFLIQAPAYHAKAGSALFADYDVTLVGFLRRHDRWVHALYKQHVKGNLTRYPHAMRRYVNQPPPQLPDLCAFDLPGRTAAAAAFFRAADVRLFDLDGEERDVLKLIDGVIGLPVSSWQGNPGVLLPYNASLYQRGLPINRSLPDPASLFLQSLNWAIGRGVDVTSDEYRELLVAISTRADAGAMPDAAILTPALSRRLLDATAPVVKRLERDFGLKVARREPVPRGASRIRDRLTRDEWLSLAEDTGKMLASSIALDKLGQLVAKVRSAPEDAGLL